MIEMQARHDVPVTQNNFDRVSVPAVVTIFVPYGVICVPASVIARLDEWASWARPRTSLDSHGRCASLEGRYVSQYPGSSNDSAPPVDLPAVLAVERVVCTKLPKLSREIVRLHFVLRMAPQIIARSLSIHRAQFGNELKRSVFMVKNNLTHAG